MRICLDTNVLLPLFRIRSPIGTIQDALFSGSLELAISNEILLGYEEIVTRLSGSALWQKIFSALELLRQTRGNILHVQPSFRFGVIVVDPDDNKFVDCAIVAQADFIVTDDQHFKVLTGSGYRPQPIRPQDFIRLHLPVR